MGRVRKITVEVPEDVLRKAQKHAGEGITGTVRRGLEILAAADAYARLQKLRGRIRFSVDEATLRRDRR